MPIFFGNTNYKKQSSKIFLVRGKTQQYKKADRGHGFTGEKEYETLFTNVPGWVPGIAAKVNAQGIIQDLIINQGRDFQLQ